MKKQDLLKALEAVKPGLADKEFIEQATSFVFANGKVITYNNEISIQYPLAGLDVTGSIQAKELYDFLNKVRDDEIEVQQSAKELIFSAGKIKAGFALQTEVKLPLLQFDSIKQWLPLPEDFITALKFVLFTCADNTAKPILNCVNITTEGVIESCDNYRLTSYKTNLQGLQTAVLIPASSITELVHYSVNKMFVDESWAHFTDGTLMFSCRTFADTYPNTERLVSMRECQPVIFPEQLAETVQRAAIFHEAFSYIDVQAKHTRLYVRAKSETAWFEEWVKLEAPAEFTIRIQPAFLLDILKHTNKCELSNEKLRFVTDKWTHVAALINIV